MKITPIFLFSLIPVLSSGMDSIRDNWEMVHSSCTIEKRGLISLPINLAVDALFFAVERKNKKKIIELTEKHHINVNDQDCDGQTAIFYAITTYYDEEIIQLLFKKGANITVWDNQGETPLHHAVYAEALEALQYLCDHGKTSLPKLPAYRLLNKAQKTPLELAIEIQKNKRHPNDSNDKNKKIIEYLALKLAAELDESQKNNHKKIHHSLDLPAKQSEEKEPNLKKSCPELSSIFLLNTNQVLGYLEHKQWDNINALSKSMREK